MLDLIFLDWHLVQNKFIKTFHSIRLEVLKPMNYLSLWIDPQMLQTINRALAVNWNSGVRSPHQHLSLIFFHWARTIGVEVIDGLSEWRLTDGWDPQMLHDPVGHNAQRGSRINLNTTHFRWSNIPCIMQGSNMFPFNLHVFCGEGDAGKSLWSVVAMVTFFLSAYSKNLGRENLCIY